MPLDRKPAYVVHHQTPANGALVFVPLPKELFMDQPYLTIFGARFGTPAYDLGIVTTGPAMLLVIDWPAEGQWGIIDAVQTPHALSEDEFDARMNYWSTRARGRVFFSPLKEPLLIEREVALLTDQIHDEIREAEELGITFQGEPGITRLVRAVFKEVEAMEGSRG
jgi:hypothetical protein